MKTCTKNLFFGLLATLLIFGGMLYLVSNTLSVEAEKETPEWVTETHDNLTSLRQEAKLIYNQIQETKRTLEQLEYMEVRNREMRECLSDKLVAENGESIICEMKGPLDVLQESFQ